jgi:chloramphenicol 3-O-phosphotransferase
VGGGQARLTPHELLTSAHRREGHNRQGAGGRAGSLRARRLWSQVAEQRVTVIVITGIQAAGKSTIAQALAERLDRSVHLRGDVFRKMVVNGRAEMGSADPPPEAVSQLRLRYALAATVADGYAEAGFNVVLQDIIIGGHLAEMVAAIRHRPLYVVVLAPRADVVQARENARRLAIGKTAYKPGDQSVAELDAAFRLETPAIGLWLDTSQLTVPETVDEILARICTEAAV